MLPRPSVLLNIPKTGSTFTRRFFDAADVLAFRRRFGSRRLRVPGRAGIELVRRLKRHGPAYGNLNCRLAHHHTGVSRLPPPLRALPKICTLRNVAGWYGSYCAFYTRPAPKRRRDRLLARAIRMLVDGVDREPDGPDRRQLLEHRNEFLERFEREDATADSLENLSVEFVVWFSQTVRLKARQYRSVGLQNSPSGLGLLTVRAIKNLFDDPRKVLALRGDALQEYFASGRYRKELRCDYFLDFADLTGQLGAVMVDALGYDPDVVGFLGPRFPRFNASPADRALRVRRELQAGDLLARIREREAIYETYLLPLARTDGACARSPSA